MSLGWLADQLQSINNASARPPLLRFNPRPAGIIQKGSTTDEILQILMAHHDRYFTCEQLMSMTKRTHSAVSFSLLYLRGQQLVDTVQDLPRNSRYLRYQIKKSKGAQ
jgi:hypothetical protein